MINGLKLGVAFNLFTLLLLTVYTVSVEYYFRPFNFVRSPSLEFGTAVSGMKIFSDANPRNHALRPAWAKIENNFDLFIPEFQLRADWRQPSPREHPGFANMQKYDIFVNFFKLPTRTLPKNLF